MKKQLNIQQANKLLLVKHATAMIMLLAVSFFFIAGCKKEILPARQLASGQLTTPAATSANLPAEIPAALMVKPGKFGSSSSLNQNGKPGVTSADGLSIHPEYRNMVLRALMLSATTCDDNTKVFQWLSQQLSDWNSTVTNYAFNTGMLDLPMYYALIFENNSSNQYFGTKGQYTQRLTKTFKDLKRFWKIQSDGIVLAAMHGSMLRDKNKLFKTYQAVYDLNTEDALYYADLVSNLLQVFPQYRNGDHPIFTFNSFAQSSFYFPTVGTIPSKIIMGDGIMEAFTAIGYNDVAPQAILAHEFGHQIQFQLGVSGTETSPEATRRKELMADAYAAYYLSHARGASMQWKRVQQFLQVFFNIGDCSTTLNGHHGTPTQRMAAANWAYQLADNAQKQGHILSSQAFTALFDAQLQEILTH